MVVAEGAPYLRVRALTKMFGAFTALNDISLDIYPREFVVFLGPSGCGKTTLLRAIAGLDIQTSGTIEQGGRDISGLPPAERDFGIVFQSYALFPNLTVAANIGYGLVSRGAPRAQIKARVVELLDLVGLPDSGAKYPAQLSGGQQQRVALARALAISPGLLLLDEPLSALDLKLRQAMRDELRTLQRDTGITFVFVTHDQEEALDMSDRIAVLGGGEVQQIGTPAEIYEEPVNRFVADFVGETNFLDVEVLETAGGQATIRTPFGVALTVPATGHAAKGRATLSVRPEKINLGDQAQGVVFEGRITNKNYMGGYTHYTLDVAGTELRASRRNASREGDTIPLGATVPVGFVAGSARVLAA